MRCAINKYHEKGVCVCPRRLYTYTVKMQNSERGTLVMQGRGRGGTRQCGGITLRISGRKGGGITAFFSVTRKRKLIGWEPNRGFNVSASVVAQTPPATTLQ